MPATRRPLLWLTAALVTLQAGAEAPVQVEPVSTRNVIRQVNVNGTVTSPRTAVLSTAVAGIVAQLDIDEGHRAAKGDVLLTLDPELAQLALERAQADVSQRETALADARRRFAEAEKVGTMGRGIPRTEIESRQAEVASEVAALAASTAAAREQQALLERHTLRAPFSGVISQRMTELGEWVNPGDDLLELVATNGLRFDFQVGQDLYGELSKDTPIDVTLDALPGQTLSGRVDTIVPIKNRSSRTFLVRAMVDSSDSSVPWRITPGMSVRGRLNMDTGRSSIVVSRDAILRYPDGRVTVWTVEPKDEVPVVTEHAVTTGTEFGSLVEITAGLDSDDVVVTRGNETLQENQPVTILSGE